MRIKTQDKVVVLSGKDRGKEGKVMAVDREAGKVTVEGVNEVKRHVRRSQRNMQGGRLSKNMPVPVGKVMFVCPSCNKPTRVGYKFDEAGKKVRFCKKCEAVVVEAPYTKKR
ncbi:MAG: 50S ribosomal protein L24 [Thermoguttaceae bacterium]|nr:50S ribosomal protein L24 [Thermoguttaceae bacterium]